MVDAGTIDRCSMAQACRRRQMCNSSLIILRYIILSPKVLNIVLLTHDTMSLNKQ